ncbi:MAG: heat-inducible transcriptional repressor HrcA [Bifidobacterium tibiigranuli]|jgi:heat-inducible transcriptional repressor|uniref:heat-inducible transcriptional repressor HrcA n=1 Tax=Bifidobacterium tibiigranuli TaxID=2172043 RepID=UPI0026EB9DE3|nr:heat-inducible transcriptional repressor HrcA [Bifidobacterium tibiigranuli]MCI1673487.1 heat-inducible transcriptional repressor HrcA [Bifidobacterium tibiigranuli]MCI1712787.1 heat-inducible transcriptional repressor HrcA [Bifidobacterium tibiigranuli]MCI1833510.1 heat-inducible transcriptional repressor HrcA [Bifidobacterium tibiigranuli]
MEQSRRMIVLRAVIEDYIRSQEPVGSSSLTKHHDLGVSSATVRNDMAALEDEGYLIQPHTSAGRIPTEQGYRYFVDRLSTVVPLTQAQRRGIGRFLQGSISLQDTLQRAARLLANITGQVAVVSSPALSKTTLRHVELVPIAMSTVLAVIITDTGSVAQHTLDVPAMPERETVSAFSNRVNDQCVGLSLAKAAEQVRQLVKRPDMTDVQRLATVLAQAFESMAEDETAGDLYMAGTSRLAHRRSIVDLAPLFDALEEQVVLMKLMSSLSEESSGVGVAIGSETHTPGLMHSAVVTSGYGHSSNDLRGDAQAQGQGTGTQSALAGSDQPVAFVGSIGPTHMDYSTTMAAVRAVARYLTVLVSHDSYGAYDADGQGGGS